MLINLLIFIVAAFILYKLITGDFKKKKEIQDKKKETLVATGVMTKDPICGTYVPANGDIRVKQGDKVHNFCSYECRDKFMNQLEAK